MLTSFFGKSNPVNYLLLGIFIFLGYLLGAIFGSAIFISPILLLKHSVFIIISVLSMLLLDFIIRKNALTRNHTYAILFFSCFMVMVPVIFLSPKILLANIFLLLALRRIISLGTDKNSEKKILDASLWITVASFFYFYSLLFFIPLWAAIVKKPNSTYKQMLVPVMGFFCAFIINMAYHLLFKNSFEWFFRWKDSIGFDFSTYNYISLLLPVAIILTILIWTGITRGLNFSKLSSKEKPTSLLLILVLATSVFVSMASPEKNGSELLFLFGPLSIVSANYIETPQTERTGAKDVVEFWFKELLLWLVVLLPVVLLFF